MKIAKRCIPESVNQRRNSLRLYFNMIKSIKITKLEHDAKLFIFLNGGRTLFSILIYDKHTQKIVKS